ncbi:MAG: DUF3604 domain-containing protein [Deltaproteobacteria bacterium]|nr:DUF3604 domain-containing protein [Deltaproteobacteria bacterium]
MRFALLLVIAGALSCSSKTTPARDAGDGGVDSGPPRSGPCDHHDPLRQVFFGDLHVHTANSFDAQSYRVRATPSDAYRFAQGGVLDLAGKGALAKGYRLARPLDFAAVTDHSEYLGEIALCTSAGSEIYDAPFCEGLRASPLGTVYGLGLRIGSLPATRVEACGTNDALCLARAQSVWQRTVEAAEAAYDRSAACRFTSFAAYEWSSQRTVSMLHRNVIFRDHRVPAQVTSFFEESEPRGLWAALERDCLKGVDGCDVVAIPHNSNLSDGLMFDGLIEGATPIDAALAATQAKLEPVIEVSQHKGDAECINTAEDELCDFETFGNQQKLSYVREGLKQGLLLGERLGTNPFKMGMIGSSDTHNAIPGAVEEDRFVGAFGNKDDTDTRLLAEANIAHNPGGLAAIWAEENSRESLFDALKRREVYATTGPRIVLRMFAGWSLPSDLCNKADWVKLGYQQGVPMGSELKARPSSAKAPMLIVSALRDVGSDQRPGTKLQRIQIIKGWLDGDQPKEQVYEIAGDPQNAASVALDSCTPQGPGHDSLCAVWSDPQFDPSQRAFYYARVVENPSCRWNSWICLRNKIDCSQTIPPGFGSCCDANVKKTIQERAYSSPIWYTPSK